MVVQTDRKSIGVPSFTPAKLDEITRAVRAFCVIYNTSLTYATEHQVFKKTVEERMPVFRAALAGIQEIPLLLDEGQIRVGSVPLEPGSGMFQKFSNELEGMGISSISILPCISAEDIRKVMRIVVTKSADIAGSGFQHFLAEEGVAGIVENKTRTHTAGTRSAGSKRSARGTAGPVVSRRSRKSGATAVFYTDAGSEPFAPALQPAESVSASRSVRDFVQGAIGALARNEARIDEVADIISTEFEHRLNEKVEEVKKAGERKLRRLESMQGLVLKELENRDIAALIMDSHLRILSANRLGQEVLGMTSIIEKESSLGIFVMSQRETQEVKINGLVRTARLLTSRASGGGNSLMLLALE